ncbi:MAG: glycosyl hydrolase [Halanaerobiales bacterium]|jgi:xylan 1,4-beta-xylosidase|nr:glycosyl hydrolase [Halanaerobiales bacterium]HPZ62097.1 glycosyl hydrolase [Halanaerobiales bacterium]HQD03406.1 glycosyl hydrolase [Halanaerobiales bacterium]
MKKVLEIPVTGQPFQNNVTYCVGTGRIGLALQKEYLDHLKIVQESISFKYIRGHGLFSDDVGIYREYEIDGEIQSFYNFTYLDRIIDSYLENNIKPFLELGFMPEKLKSGEETIFYWKGNVSPPTSYEKWAELVRVTLNHLIERYGREEVITWPIEVWNEPNIGFWAGSMEDYFTLYEYSARVIKEVDPRIQVGGPAICGVETEKWFRGFFEFCIENDVPVDFISRHCYTANQPSRQGHYLYHTLNEPTYMIDELKETREIMGDYPQIANLPLHITEFNSSYVPVCPVHDTDFHAAYIARILSEAGEYADSYSYWTFSDVFEEQDVPKAVFHGGFGLVALNSIKKPTFYAFEFFSRAGKELLYRDDNLIVTRDEDRYVIIGWNWANKAANERERAKSYLLKLPSIGEEAILLKKEVGGAHANPLQTWSNLGKPRTLNKEQLAILQASAEPLQVDERLRAEEGSYEVEINIGPNRICMLEIKPVNDQSNTYPGYDEDFVWLEE